MLLTLIVLLLLLAVPSLPHLAQRVCLTLLTLVILIRIGRTLHTTLFRPFNQLEEQLTQMSNGHFTPLKEAAALRELATLTSAVNRIIHELEQRQRLIMQTEKLASIGVLAAGVAHELNNPLSNISIANQLLQEELTEAEPEQLQTWLAQIAAESDRGRNIVRTLLDFGSQRHFQRQTLNLKQLIERLRPLITKTLQRTGTELVLNIPPHLELSADRQRLQQLLINLIQNASQAGSQRLSISATYSDRPLLPNNATMAGYLPSASDDSGPFIEIVVNDNGSGISPQHQPQLFDPFFTTKPPSEGSGLGLWIVQEIVKEHDGMIAIHSPPGHGTAVTLLFPPPRRLDNE